MTDLFDHALPLTRTFSRYESMNCAITPIRRLQKGIARHQPDDSIFYRILLTRVPQHVDCPVKLVK
jgi:hypothetical protein